MRIESSITSITWIPSEAIEGMTKLPFEMGIAHYDDPPPDRLVDLEAMHEHDLFREANELKAWIENEDGQITGHGLDDPRADDSGRRFLRPRARGSERLPAALDLRP